MLFDASAEAMASAETRCFFRILDTRILTASRIASIAVGLIYRYWHCGGDSV